MIVVTVAMKFSLGKGVATSDVFFFIHVFECLYVKLYFDIFTLKVASNNRTVLLLNRAYDTREGGLGAPAHPFFAK